MVCVGTLSTQFSFFFLAVQLKNTMHVYGTMFKVITLSFAMASDSSTSRSGKWRDPSTYNGEVVCIRCGDGWPICADMNPRTGENYSHADTCNKYWFYENGDSKHEEVCVVCEKAMAREREGSIVGTRLQ